MSKKLDPVKRITEVTYDSPKLGIRFGAFARSLEDQIREQFPSIRFTQEQRGDLRHFQKDADGYIRLSIRGLLTDSERYNVCKRLMRKVSNIVRDAINRKPSREGADRG